MAVRPVNRIAEVRLGPELRDVGDPTGVSGFNNDLIVAPLGPLPCLTDHVRKHRHYLITGTVNGGMVVKPEVLAPLKDRYN